MPITDEKFPADEPLTAPQRSAEQYHHLLIISLLVALVIFLFLVSYIVIRQQSRSLEDASVERAMATIKHLSLVSPKGLIAGDSKYLADTVRITKQTDNQIEAVSLLTLDGRPMAETDAGVQWPIDRSHLDSIVSTRDYRSGDFRIFLSPIRGKSGESLGVLFLKISLKHISRMALRAAGILDLSILAVFGVIGILFNFLFKKVKEFALRESQRAKLLELAYEELKRLQSRLAQSEKMSAIGQLCAGISHEINNPLGVILIFIQGIGKRLQPGDPLEFPVKNIEREALRCRQLVQSLLFFSRTSNTAQWERLDLRQTIQGALSLVEVQAKTAGVGIVRDLESAPASLLGNQNQLQQVFINLCSNAIDAMPQGGTLRIRASGETREGKNWARLEVEDTGSGIPVELRSKIFEAFFTTKEPGKGTGLGLALVAEIVERHEGTIEVESDLGKGSRFIIRVPLESSKPIPVAEARPR